MFTGGFEKVAIKSKSIIKRLRSVVSGKMGQEAPKNHLRKKWLRSAESHLKKIEKSTRSRNVRNLSNIDKERLKHAIRAVKMGVTSGKRRYRALGVGGELPAAAEHVRSKWKPRFGPHSK